MFASASKQLVSALHKNNVPAVVMRTMQTATYATSAGENQPAQTQTSYNDTIGYHFSQMVKKNPFTNYLRSVHQKLNWSYQDLKKHSEAFAVGLDEFEVKTGDRVCIIQGTNAEQSVTQLACAKIGAICVELTPSSIQNKETLQKVLDTYKPTVLIMPARFNDIYYYGLLRELVPGLVDKALSTYLRSPHHPYLKHVLLTDTDPYPGTHRMKDMMVYGPFSFYENPLRRFALNPAFSAGKNLPALVVNGADKPITYTHDNLLNGGYTFGSKIGLKYGDRVLIAGHLDSTVGAVCGQYACLTHFATVVYPSEAFNAAEASKLLAIEQCTGIIGAKSDYEELLNSSELQANQHKYTLRFAVVDDSASTSFVEEIKSQLRVTEVYRVSASDLPSSPSWK